MRNASPYDDIDPMQRWSAAASAIHHGSLDPQGRVKFTIGPDEKIASAGSCFSQRIAERLRVRTNNYFIAERAPTWLTPEQAERFGYAPFSARHGLVFTTAQLLQLVDRAFGRFVPLETAWPSASGYIDPFRPRIAPEPFSSLIELQSDREKHLASVRRMFESVDVFVFTMGLTELWRDRRDGAVFPFCPGVAGGTFDAAAHEFCNLNFAQNFSNLKTFVEFVRAVNPKIKIILTVSPVPIGATIEPQHVVRATTYTKSVLRVVAEEISRAYPFVDYFAGYEMVSQAFTGIDSFVEDRRHLTSEAIERVVDTFCSHYLCEPGPREAPASIAPEAYDALLACDEDLFAR